MTKAIYKYTLNPEESTLLPIDSEFLDVQMQHGKVTLWYLVDLTRKLLGYRQYRIIGTGWTFEKTPGKYLKTIQDGNLVWHIFDAGWKVENE